MKRCPRCQTHNRDGAHFCRECGQFLDAACPNCGIELQQVARFCDHCGIRLANADSLSGWIGSTDQASWKKPETQPDEPQAVRLSDLAKPLYDSAGDSSAVPKPGESDSLQRFLPRELAAKLEAARG